MIVRSDLPHGVQVAQTIHAAGESCGGAPLPLSTHAIALSVRDEGHLREVRDRIWKAGIPHTAVHEPDPPYMGQLMAVGIWPTYDRQAVRRVTSDLPLVR